MARKAREKSSTGVYAVILRGNEEIFKAGEMRGLFSQAAEKYLGGGLMGIRFNDSRADMLVRESDKGISLDMKPLITSFARTYNKTHETDGKVFADRFKSVPVESDELEIDCLAYINGGDIAAPYISGAGAQQSVKKPAKKTEPKREEPKPPKPKKKNLPSWLL